MNIFIFHFPIMLCVVSWHSIKGKIPSLLQAFSKCPILLVANVLPLVRSVTHRRYHYSHCQCAAFGGDGRKEETLNENSIKLIIGVAKAMSKYKSNVIL